jgi:predicted Zn-ribbon and HTH transcriptional regulator
MVVVVDIVHGMTKQCKRCGHEWEAKKPNPIRCPRCTSVLWDVPKEGA